MIAVEYITEDTDQRLHCPLFDLTVNRNDGCIIIAVCQAMDIPNLITRPDVNKFKSWSGVTYMYYVVMLS